ncbi:hypothetical protein NKH77_05565 [Streptomyces sp. M19]
MSRAPLRGYRVTELLAPEEVEELYGLRLLLEPPSAAAAARAMNDRHAAALRAELRTCPRRRCVPGRGRERTRTPRTRPTGRSPRTTRACTSWC